MESELDRLLERARRGDPEAWRSLVAKLQDLVYGVPHRFDLAPEDVADVFMETFGALHRNLDRIESGGALPSWLARTATRSSLRIRRLKSRDDGISLEDVVALEDTEAEYAARVADETYELHWEIDRMDEGCRTLLKALYLEGASYADVTERFGIAPGAISPRRARCLEKLRRSMISNGFFD